MAETRYIISDAARMINVEPHVLRYWEEELAIEIPRNELGHRYYTEKEIHLFEKRIEGAVKNTAVAGSDNTEDDQDENTVVVKPPVLIYWQSSRKAMTQSQGS